VKKQKFVIIVTIVLVAGFLLASESDIAKAEKKAFDGKGKVLVRGSPIKGANGLMFDKNDSLHIASVFGREIVVMDPKTGKILNRLGPDVGVEGPDDLTFGPEGSPYEGYIYWTSILTGEVGRLSSSGVKTGQFVAPGVNPITFTDAAPYRLFTALDFLGDGFYEVDPDLSGAPITLHPTLFGLNGFDFGPDGYLYGPLFAYGLVRIDVNETPPVTPILVADGFFPAAAKFDSQGRLHSVDIITGNVFRINKDTGDKELIAEIEPGLDNLAFDSRDRVFVSNSVNGAIYHVLPSGQVRTISRGGMIGPGGVCVVPRPRGGESVFVADYWSLKEFNGRTGRAKSQKIHSFGVLDNFLMPYTVSPYDGNLVLSSAFASMAQVWNPEASVIEATGAFVYPKNAVQFQNNIAVAELGSGSVIHWDPETDGRITLASGLYVPSGLAAIGNDLWVSDWASGLVWQIVADGAPVMLPVASGLSLPEGLAFDTDGSLLVVESGAGRLSRIDLLSGIVSTVVDGLALGDEAVPGYEAIWSLSDVAVGPSGYIYVTGDVANCLYRFKPTR